MTIAVNMGRKATKKKQNKNQYQTFILQTRFFRRLQIFNAFFSKVSKMHVAPPVSKGGDLPLYTLFKKISDQSGNNYDIIC